MTELDLRSPSTVEQLVKDCLDKLQHEESPESDVRVEVLIRTEVMLDIAQRLLRIEGEAAQ